MLAAARLPVHFNNQSFPAAAPEGIFSQRGRELEDRKNVPQRLKPGIAVILMARLKPCPSSMIAFPRKI
jgi:hypothetical protein